MSSETAPADLDGAVAAVGERQARRAPAKLRVELIENAPQTVPRQRAGAFLDVTVEQRADAHPIRRYQAGPGIVEPGGEQVSRALRVGEQRGEQPAIRLVVHGVAAPLELACDLRRVSRADLRQLAPKTWPGGLRRRGQEVRHIAAARQRGQQRRQVEPGRTRPDKLSQDWW